MATKGAYGITRTEYRRGDMICLTCYRSWRDDITPAGRCPWEYQHATDQRAHVDLRMRRAVIASLQD